MSETAVVFQAPPAAAVARRRGRPEKFSEAVQAALTARPGEFGVIQTDLKAPGSRVSTLKAKYGASFEFTYAEGSIFARFVPPVAETEPATEGEPEVVEAGETTESEVEQPEQTEASDAPAPETAEVETPAPVALRTASGRPSRSKAAREARAAAAAAAE